MIAVVAGWFRAITGGGALADGQDRPAQSAPRLGRAGSPAPVAAFSGVRSQPSARRHDRGGGEPTTTGAHHWPVAAIILDRVAALVLPGRCPIGLAEVAR